MSHMLDMTKGRAAIAYRNEVPWHGLGQQMPDTNDVDLWQKAAGLDYVVRRAPVQFVSESGAHAFPSRHVLYRSDTDHPLSVVSDGYKVVQPAQIMEFFRDIVELGGYQMETAGALSDGKRIWALAKASEGTAIGGKDIIRPYLLLATSYDASMSTVAKFVCERVVCHNTITVALGESGDTIRVHHGKDFNADDVKRQLGLGAQSWEQFVVDMKVLANRSIDREAAEGLTLSLLPKPESVDPRQTQGYKRIMSLFEKGIGSELTEGPSLWRWLNAVTQYTDWERGITVSSRMNSAWFGEGDATKTKAMQIALAAA